MGKVGSYYKYSGYDINNMKIMNERFKTTFETLEILCDNNKGYKLGVYDEKLYISCNWIIIQSIHRYYYGENRLKVTNFIKKVFNDYFIFYDMILSCINYDDNEEIRLEAEKLKNDNIDIMKKWSRGLVLFSELYKEDNTIMSSIESIILKLNNLSSSSVITL